MTQPSTIDTENEPEDRSGPVILFHSYDNSYDLTIGSLLKLDAPSFVLRRNRGNGWLACGRSDGFVNLFDSQLQEKQVIQVEENSVVTNLRWRPVGISRAPVLLAVTSQGLINHYHAESGRLLISQRESNNSIMALDYSPTGRMFATAGRDFSVRVYDEATKSIDLQFSGSRFDSKGHTNRVFALRFIDQNLIVSGGWDSVLHIWDVRSGKSQRSIFGPNLSGDSIDYLHDKLLTGSHRDREQLQIYDIGSGKVIQTISYSSTRSVAYVYSVMFYKGDVLAGSSGHNALRVFSRENSYTTVNEVEMGGGCYSIDAWQGTLAYVNSAGDLGLINCSR